MEFLKRFVKRILQWDSSSPSPGRKKMKWLINSYQAWNLQGKRLDVSIRYHPVVNYLRRMQQEYGKDLLLCDVGSGDIGLRYFMQKRCVCVDIDMSEKVYSWGLDVDPIKGSVLGLPLEDGIFDAVVSLDVIDDIHPEKRKEALSELFRITNNLIVIGVPYGRDTRRYVGELYEARLQGEDVPDWVEIDVQMGTPDEDFDELVSEVMNQYPNSSLFVKESENLNLLRLRIKLQRMIGPPNPLFRPIFEVISALSKRLNMGVNYRRIYFVALKGGASQSASS